MNRWIILSFTLTAILPLAVWGCTNGSHESGSEHQPIHGGGHDNGLDEHDGGEGNEHDRDRGEHEAEGEEAGDRVRPGGTLAT